MASVVRDWVDHCFVFNFKGPRGPSQQGSVVLFCNPLQRAWIYTNPLRFSNKKASRNSYISIDLNLSEQTTPPLKGNITQANPLQTRKHEASKPTYLSTEQQGGNLRPGVTERQLSALEAAAESCFSRN